MANFITTALSGYAKEGFDFFIRPLFVGASPFQTPGISYEPNVRGTKKLNMWKGVTKIAKKYAKGFSGSTGATLTQRTIVTVQMKAEASQDANEFFETVYAYAQNNGIDWNKIDGTIFQNILVNIWQTALASDIFRQFWLGDTTKEKITAGIFNGVADTDYNAFSGIWKLLIDNATTTPTTDDHIFRVAIANGSVAQKSTGTFTGTAGTANVLINGVNYLATFDTDLNTTAENFVDAHTVALAARGLTLAYPAASATFTVTSAIAGMPHSVITITGVVTNLTGSVAATTANTAPADLSADEALTTLRLLRKDSSPELRAIDASQKVFLVSDSVYYNYLESIEGFDGTYKFTTENGRDLMINGAAVLNFNGSQVIKMGWDASLDADFPTAYPHRIIFTEMSNLRIGFDETNDTNAVEIWYNQDEQENRFRCQYYMGAQYVHGKFTSVAY